MSGRIALVGDRGLHGGWVLNSNQDNTLKLGASSGAGTAGYSVLNAFLATTLFGKTGDWLQLAFNHGDVTSEFPIDFVFELSDDTGPPPPPPYATNDGSYTVEFTTYNAPFTYILIVENLSHAGGGGYVEGTQGNLRNVAVEGALYWCPIHGFVGNVLSTSVTTVKQNGKNLLVHSSTAVCTATLNSVPDRKTYAE